MTLHILLLLFRWNSVERRQFIGGGEIVDHTVEERLNPDVSQGSPGKDRNGFPFQDRLSHDFFDQGHRDLGTLQVKLGHFVVEGRQAVDQPVPGFVGTVFHWSESGAARISVPSTPPQRSS